MTEVDTSRVSVKTYVPAYQKTAWVEHADQLGMNQSEFVRTMVQAGRRGFSPSSSDNPDSSAPPTASDAEPADSSPSSTDPERSEADLGERIVAILQESAYCSWDELIVEVTDDVESRVEATLQELQADGRVVHSGRHGGYVLTDGDRN